MKNAWTRLLDDRTRIVVIGELVLAYEQQHNGAWIGTHQRASPAEVKAIYERLTRPRVS